MSITAILFDLDGTLLPMDQDLFIATYLKKLAAFLAPHGYEPKQFTEAIWQGTGAMIKNDGKITNDKAFWKVFCDKIGKDATRDEPLFDEYYRTDFQSAKAVCGFNPAAAETVKSLKEKGFRLILATNPLFPPIATNSRIKWAGLEPTDFELVTTYDNCTYCKPNPKYYLEILSKLKISAEECLMVGNDVSDDMGTEGLGMKVFLLTDCLINTKNADIGRYPQGSFPELMEYINTL